MGTVTIAFLYQGEESWKIELPANVKLVRFTPGVEVELYDGVSVRIPELSAIEFWPAVSKG